MAALIVLIVVAVVVLFTLSRGIRIVPQARAGVVERLGRYQRTLDAGLALVIPYIDRVRMTLGGYGVSGSGQTRTPSRHTS